LGAKSRAWVRMEDVDGNRKCSCALAEWKFRNNKRKGARIESKLLGTVKGIAPISENQTSHEESQNHGGACGRRAWLSGGTGDSAHPAQGEEMLTAVYVFQRKKAGKPARGDF